MKCVLNSIMDIIVLTQMGNALTVGFSINIQEFTFYRGH